MTDKTEILYLRKAAKARIVEEVDGVLTEVFTSSGKQAVLYHLKKKYGVSLSDAAERPTLLAEALAKFFGEFGADVLVMRMLRRGLKIAKQHSYAELRLGDFESVNDPLLRNPDNRIRVTSG